MLGLSSGLMLGGYDWEKRLGEKTGGERWHCWDIRHGVNESWAGD